MIVYRSEVILNQYQKKASLYRSGVVLIPLGDDFRYMTGKEWDQQYENYIQIIDYVNSHAELNTKVSINNDITMRGYGVCAVVVMIQIGKFLSPKIN